MQPNAAKPMPSYTTRRRNDTVWNVLTFAVLLGTICMVGVFALIYMTPASAFNPFPPPEMPKPLVLPSETPTQVPLFPATWTPLPATDVPVVEAPTVEVVEDTPVPTEMVVQAIPALIITAEVTEPPDAVYPFDLRGQITTVASTIIHPDQGCKWAGVAGQVFDLQGAPLLGTSVWVWGTWGGKQINLLSLTGTARQYGEAGYEFTLGDTPQDAADTLHIQLLDQAGLALSPKMKFSSSADCGKNLVLINFRQVR